MMYIFDFDRRFIIKYIFFYLIFYIKIAKANNYTRYYINNTFLSKIYICKKYTKNACPSIK